MESPSRPAAAECFVKVRLGGSSSAAPSDVVLARRDAPLRRDALVVAREADGYALRRVGRVSAEGVELLPASGGAAVARVAPAAAGVVGTVVMRWTTVSD